MTNQHPLTDEICKQIVEDNVHWHPDWAVLDLVVKTCMRASYDMGREKGHDEMLKEVLKWLKNCIHYDLFYIEDRALMNVKIRRELEKAMRPQQHQQQENS